MVDLTCRRKGCPGKAIKRCGVPALRMLVTAHAQPTLQARGRDFIVQDIGKVKVDPVEEI
jgi:hypothetical protein